MCTNVFVRTYIFQMSVYLSVKISVQILRSIINSAFSTNQKETSNYMPLNIYIKVVVVKADHLQNISSFKMCLELALKRLSSLDAVSKCYLLEESTDWALLCQRWWSRINVFNSCLPLVY